MHVHKYNLFDLHICWSSACDIRWEQLKLMRVHSPIDTSMPSIVSSAIHCFKLNAKQMKRKKKPYSMDVEHNMKESIKKKRNEKKEINKKKTSTWQNQINEILHGGHLNSYKLNSIHYLYVYFHLSIQDESFVRCEVWNFYFYRRNLLLTTTITRISIITLPSLDFKFVGSHSLSDGLLFFIFSEQLALSSMYCTSISQTNVHTGIVRDRSA